MPFAPTKLNMHGSPRSSAETRKGRNIWVVDDDEIQHFIMRKMFSHFPAITIVELRNGKEALDKISSNYALGVEAPDSIFVDINMPVINGWEFIENVEAKWNSYLKSTAIYILSSSCHQSDKNRTAQFSSVICYLLKPLSFAQLKYVLEKMPSPHSK